MCAAYTTQEAGHLKVYLGDFFWVESYHFGLGFTKFEISFFVVFETTDDHSERNGAKNEGLECSKRFWKVSGSKRLDLRCSKRESSDVV